MSQVGKLYKFYLGKIFHKSWLRIIVFTILIGVVGGFVIPFAANKVFRNIAEKRSRGSEQDKPKEDGGFSELARVAFGGKTIRGESIESLHLKNRQLLEEDSKLAEGKDGSEDESKKMPTSDKMVRKMFDSSNFLVFSLPYTADNVFFFCKTEGYNEGKNFGQLLFNIAWGNLTGFLVLYGFIFEIFDKTFSSPRQDGEEAMVLTMTPGVKRSDLLWGKVLAFLTFYCLINVVLFLIPFGIYYGGLASAKSLPWFSLLALITTIAGPILFFGLIFTPYLFITSIVGGGKGIFSLLMSSFPLIGAGIKMFSSASGPHTVESAFFDPIGFTAISLVCGIFFLTLYYLRYQEEDLG